MSTATITAPTSTRAELSVTPGFTPDSNVSDEMRLWAASTLADLPTVVRFSVTRRVKEGAGKDGKLWRKAFEIAAIPGNRFSISLAVGAGPDDLAHAERIVDRAKQGWFNSDIWRPHTFKTTGREGFVLDCYWAWDGKPSIDELRPCEMRGCVQAHHLYRRGELNSAHAGESIVNEFYDVRLFNHEDEDGWAASVSFDPDLPDGPTGLKIVRDAANDLDWLQQQADNLNSAAVSGR